MDAAQIESQIKSAPEVWELKKEFDTKGKGDHFGAALDKAIKDAVPASAHESALERILQAAVRILRYELKKALRNPPTTRAGRWLRAIQNALGI